MTLIYSTAAIAAGYIADLLLGDPYNFPHIVRFIGSFIAFLEKRLRAMLPQTESGERRAGVILVIIVLAASVVLPAFVLGLAYRLMPVLGFVVEAFLVWQLLAVKSLKDESMKVFSALSTSDIEKARRAVSMIVGRDTQSLTAQEITLAAVETVAENTSDGVIAPMLYTMVFGAVGGCFYKAINTMDSMLGYKNEKYLYFGRAAARLDDYANLIPSRLTAVIVVASSFLLRLNSRAAYETWKRDRNNHPSPNSAQSMSAFAGAMGIRMGGAAVYHGKVVSRPYIGDNKRGVTPGDIGTANKITFVTSVLMLVLMMIVRGAVFAIL